MIHVLATVQLHEGKRESFLAALRANLAAVRAEVGCILYVPCEDIATEIPRATAARPNVITIVERWSDLEALQAHLRAPHMITYREKVKDCIASAQLQILHEV